MSPRQHCKNFCFFFQKDALAYVPSRATRAAASAVTSAEISARLASNATDDPPALGVALRRIAAWRSALPAGVRANGGMASVI